MWLYLLLFSSISFADDFSSEKYCFRSTKVEVAKQKLAMIQVPSDVVNVDSNCLVIQMREHRRELIQRYVLSTFNDAEIAFSSEDVRREPCKLKVEKEKVKTVDDLNIDLGKSNNEVIKIDTAGNETETMQIQTLKEFELTVDQDQILGTCRYISPERYNIVIEVRKNLKPLVPVTLPPGSIVVMNQPPQDQETSSLKTEVQLTRGERLNIGEVVKKLKDQNRNVDIRPSASIETQNQNQTERVFLSLQ